MNMKKTLKIVFYKRLLFFLKKSIFYFLSNKQDEMYLFIDDYVCSSRFAFSIGRFISQCPERRSMIFVISIQIKCCKL